MSIRRNSQMIKSAIYGCLLLICSAFAIQTRSEPAQDSYTVTTLSTDEIVLTQQLTTHKRNYLVNFEYMQLTYINDGDVIPLKDGTFLNNWVKSYFNGGGAFCYSSIRKPSGELIAILDQPEANNSLPRVEFNKLLNETLSQMLSSANKKELCVYQK